MPEQITRGKRPLPLVDDVTEPDEQPGSLSAELAGMDVPAAPEKPAGSPTLLPLTAVDHAARADYWEAVSRLPVKDGQLTLSMDDFQENMLKGMAVLARMVADIVAALRVVALPQAVKAYDAWAKSADQEQILALFGWYQASNKPGEAEPSPN